MLLIITLRSSSCSEYLPSCYTEYTSEPRVSHAKMLSVVTRTLLVAAALTPANALPVTNAAGGARRGVKQECACAQHETDHPFRLCLELSFGGAQRSHDWCNCNGILHPLNQRAGPSAVAVRLRTLHKTGSGGKGYFFKLGREKGVSRVGHCNTLVRFLGNPSPASMQVVRRLGGT